MLEIILVLGIITAGCIGSSSTPEQVNSTTTQGVERTVTFTPNTTSIIDNQQDPIIGVWRENYSYGYDDRYRFFADGTFVESFSLGDKKRTLVTHGTWRAEDSNSYVLKDAKNESFITFILDPERNVIYPLKNSISVLTPFKGDVIIANE
jgi:ABC-type Fe3+-hydroxamate transport system substrate-binding protein